MHSLNLAEHQYKKCGEIDFVVLGPPGLFVLEVKGGRIGCQNGVWTFTDRYGRERRKAEGPFAQAQSAAFSLLDRLKTMVGAGELPRLVLGWAAVFPDQEFTERSVEWAPEMVLDERACRTASDLERALRRLIRYWTDKSGARSLSEHQVEVLQKAMRPEFDLVPSLRIRGERIDLELESLTNAQYRLLDIVQDNDRILCAGGAGTGKTFLAAEVARREAAAGRSVVVICRSPILARFLGDQPGLNADRCRVSTLQNLGSGQRYDCLVVDEAQDLMNLDDLARMDELLVGGLDRGRWRLFYDANNQSGVLGRFDPSAMHLLLEASPARVGLPDNCRNTRDIVTEVQLMTGADIGVSSAGAGIPVEYTFWTTPEEAASQLSAHLESLLKDGVDPRHITVLSPSSPEKSCVMRLPPKLLSKLKVLDSQTVTDPPQGIGFAAIRDFKGLENRFVCVTDITDLRSSVEAVNTLYVAMTRPRAGLWLGVRADLRSEVKPVRVARPSADATSRRSG